MNAMRGILAGTYLACIGWALIALAALGIWRMS